MGALEFVSSLVGSLAWPVAVILLVFILRRPLGKMLSERPVKTFEAGPSGVKVEYFDEKLEEARSELAEARTERPALSTGVPAQLPDEVTARDDFMYEMQQLAEVAPSAVVLESFARLEKVLRDALDGAPGDGRPRRRLTSVRELVRRAGERGLMTPSEAAAFDDVVVLRNIVAHGGTADLDANRALSYASLVRQLIASILLAQGRNIGGGPVD